ncbi:MAG: putative membrane protein, partial [Polyangiales bacterium]
MILDDASRTTILIHYYRAMVGRADIWRVRMDTTTNWAIGATAALISFSLGNAVTPHYVVYLSSFLTVIFLLLEARRLTFYHLWQQRVFLLERALIQPAAQPDTTDPPDSIALDELAL